jgi:hypothetical protein
MTQNSNSVVLSHWHTLFEDFSTSTQDFYASVETAVRERKLPDIEISRVLWSEGGIGSAKREYLRIRRKRIAFDICSAPYGGGHFFSWWLARIPPKFGAFITIAILFAALLVTGIASLMLSLVTPKGGCAAGLGSLFAPLFLYPGILLLLGYLVQEGSLGDEEWVMSLPVLGWLYVFFFNPLTYYRQDTAMMFRDSVRNAVGEIINDVREQKGLRLLGDDDLRPEAPGEAPAPQA